MPLTFTGAVVIGRSARWRQWSMGECPELTPGGACHLDTRCSVEGKIGTTVDGIIIRVFRQDYPEDEGHELKTLITTG